VFSFLPFARGLGARPAMVSHLNLRGGLRGFRVAVPMVDLVMDELRLGEVIREPEKRVE